MKVVLIWRDHSASLHKDFSSSKPKSLDELLPESQKAKNKHKKKAQGQVNMLPFTNFRDFLHCVPLPMANDVLSALFFLLLTIIRVIRGMRRTRREL